MSESSHMEKIQQIILDLSGEAAFSGEAMKQFLELKDEVEKQERTIDFLRGQNREKVEELKQVEKRLEDEIDKASQLFEEVQHWRKKSVDLAGRESQIAILEAKVNHAEQRVEDHQNMVGLVFRNAEVRRTVLGSEHHYNPGHPEERDQYGGVTRYAEPSGLVQVPVKKDETETTE